MVEEMERRLNAGFQWVELAQTDGYQPCECEKCKAIHSEPAERLWIVHRKLAEIMPKRCPGKRVMIISYGPTHHPPKTFETFLPNVVIQLTGYSEDNFKEWERFDVDKAVYIYNWGAYHIAGFAPKRTPRYVVNQIRSFVKNRVRGIYICGGFKNKGPWSLDGPAYYAFGKALENPDREPEELLDEFVEASSPMKLFYRILFQRLESYSLFDHPIGPSPRVPSPFRPPEDFYSHFFPPNLLDKLSQNLERAVAIARTEEVKARLRLLKADFSYVQNLASIFHLYRAYRTYPSWELLGLLETKVRKRKQFIDSLYQNARPIKIKGLPAPLGGPPKDLLEAGGRLGGILSAPLNWDFDSLWKKRVLPGTQKRKVVVVKAKSAVKLDGRLDELAWKASAPFQTLNEISMGALKNALQSGL